MKNNKFTAKVLASYDKSEKVQLEEKIEDFRQKAIIGINTKIVTIQSSTIPLLHLKLQEKNREFISKKQEKEKIIYSLHDSFDDYINKINQCSKLIFNIEQDVENIKSSIEEEENRIKEYEDLKKRLTE